MLSGQKREQLIVSEILRISIWDVPLQDAAANEMDSGTELEDEIEEIGSVEEKEAEEKKDD